MDRIYLSVSPEEYPEVKASGASWDDASKNWYIGPGMAPAVFSRWLGEDQGEAPFSITSEEAFVAGAQANCRACGREFEVICVYCRTGMDVELGQIMTQFTVSNISAMDEALAQQLERWPHFRAVGEGEGFANHCAYCGTVQPEQGLHSEPGDVFFAIRPAEGGGVEFTALEGRIQLSGDYGFEV